MARTLAFRIYVLVLVIVGVAILAAIAIPNFMESTRLANFHYQQKQLRKIAAAMEAYRADWGGYPASEKDSPLPGHGTRNEIDQRLLTTPTAYLKASIPDRFRVWSNTPENGVNYQIYAVSYVNSAPSFSVYPRTAWMTWSIGPDLKSNTGGYLSLKSIEANEASPHPSLTAGIRYDPTNGLNGSDSDGDIYIFGGNAM